jgi:NAD(P)-dependent dehydrogenase (short-subunit alcohol dehydrogenase family)
MNGKTVVVTGATSGIGEVAAETLARVGARILFVARSEDKAKTLLSRLVRANPDVAHAFVLADLSVLSEMKSAARGLLAKASKVDVLINNAGAIFDHREVTPDGLERTFAVNHRAYFVVTEMLLPAMSPDARIVSTASTAHNFAKLDFDDLQTAKGYSAFGAYGRSKLCNILWTRELARRLAPDGVSGVTANCVHPGGVNTGFGDNAKGWLKPVMALAKRFMITPAQGADTLIWLAQSPEVAGKTGAYWSRRLLVTPSAAGRDDAAALRLWRASADIAGLPA